MEERLKNNWQMAIIIVAGIIAIITACISAEKFETIYIIPIILCIPIIWILYQLLNKQSFINNTVKKLLEITNNFTTVKNEKEKYENLIQELKEHLTRTKEAFIHCSSVNVPKEERFFVTDDELLEEEGALDGGEVIIFSHEITMDPNPPFINTIISNINKGIKYHYYIPDNNYVKGNFKKLKDKVDAQVTNSDFKTNLICDYLPDGLITNGITLYTSKKCGYLNVPDKLYEKRFFTKIDDDYYSKIMVNIETMEKYKKKLIV